MAPEVIGTSAASMAVELIRTVVEMRRRTADARLQGSRIALVPTMGALHAGHGALMDRAREQGGTVVVSIFVNPIQFDRRDDYEKYGRMLENDLDFCRTHGVDVVFAPDLEEMYPDQQQTFVEVESVSTHLCGAFRPGHFRGVATVVTKLFNIVQPDAAYFGEKDGQQLAVIRRMVGDLNLPVTIVPVPTVRERDGLALSSRNERLGPEERAAAPVLYRALNAARDAIRQGSTDPAEIRRVGLSVLLSEPLVRVEYFEIVDAAQMQPVDAVVDHVVIAGAIWLGATRLIDNVVWQRELHPNS